MATLIVALAVAAMVSLGFWQLRRLREKEDLLARYAAAGHDLREVAWPAKDAAAARLLYRRARLVCAGVTGHSSMAGRNAQGEAGAAQTARCRTPDGADVLVVLGWSRRPDAAAGWRGGVVHGTIAPGPRLVADPPVAGLAPNARPDPADIPNNHLSYAIQWFLFAGVAVVIYGLALRRRLGRG